MLEEIYYPTQNFQKTELQILQRVVEQLGDIAKFAAKRPDPNELARHLCRAFAWTCALCVKFDIRNIADLIWHKFPGACPYCASCPCACSGEKPMPNPTQLERLRKDNVNHRPRNLYEWQGMFDSIYSERNLGDAAEDIKEEVNAPLYFSPRKLSPLQYRIMLSFAHLCEEIGETSRAIRERYFRPAELRDEIADIFAWIMSIANLLHHDPKVGSFSLADHLWSLYPGVCRFCGACPCACSGAPVEDVLTVAGTLMSFDYDRLTGVGSADAWQELLRKTGADARGLSRAQPLGLIYVDLNDFKQIQDSSTKKHEQGDEILREVGSILKGLQKGRIMPFRVGGDEFIVLAGTMPSRDTEVLGSRIGDLIAQHPFRSLDGGRQIHLTASIGVANSERDGLSLETLRSTGDKRMYEEKAARKCARG
jgi:diguanylate cyclase (GGDEF)-like protein